MQMDALLGTVDPYAVLFFNGMQHTTETIKGSYTPEWNETFIWDISEIEKGCRSDFVVQVNDWDATCKDDEVGSFTIPASRMSEILRAKIGWEGQETFTLYREGKGVVGQDKELSEIALKVAVVKVPKAFAMLSVDEENLGPRKINVTLVSAKHLPKVSAAI
jgi:Ca2+-dependent lipid-binding protein